MREIAILATAAAGRASFVWYAHERLARDVLSKEERDALRERRPLKLDDARDQVVHDITRSLTDNGDLNDSLYERGVSLLGHEGLVELIWVVGVYQIDTLQLRVHRLGAPEATFEQ